MRDVPSRPVPCGDCSDANDANMDAAAQRNVQRGRGTGSSNAGRRKARPSMRSADKATCALNSHSGLPHSGRPGSTFGCRPRAAF